jgi:hypothetical protein
MKVVKAHNDESDVDASTDSDYCDTEVRALTSVADIDDDAASCFSTCSPDYNTTSPCLDKFVV